jgi:hypothetical protein
MLKNNNLFFGTSTIMLVLLSLTVSCKSVAQSDITGVYKIGHSGDPQGGETLFVLANNRFAVLYFGGALIGTWKINGNQVDFTPTMPATGFTIFGRHNKKLGTRSRIFFGGFERGAPLMAFDKDAGQKPILKRVFNPGANCLEFPTVTKFPTVPKTIVFTALPETEEGEKPKTEGNIYIFKNDEGYNDFIANYTRKSRDVQPFHAEIKAGSLYFNEQEAPKAPLSTSGDDIKQINMLFKIPLNPDKVFYNAYYKDYQESHASPPIEQDTLNYRFDAKKDAYINFPNYEEGEENRPKKDDFNNENVIYKFVLLPVNKVMGQYSVDERPLFTSVCKNQ